MTEVATPPRSDVPVDRTWDAESVFSSVEAWDAALEALVADLPGLESFAGRLEEGPDVTIDALVARDDLMRRAGQVFVYAYLDYSVDTTAQDAVARFGKAQTAFGQMLAAVAFIEPELLALGRERLAEWSAERPELAPYGHYLDDLFRRGEHVRSVEVEELFGQLADAHGGPYAIYSGLVDGDLGFADATGESGESAEVTQGSVEALLTSPDRALRQSAWESYADGFRSVRNALVANYATAIKMDVFSGRARRHESTRSASLFASNIPIEVFDNLLATFSGTCRPGTATGRCARPDRRRHAAAVRPLGAARSRAVPAHVRAVRGLGVRVARAARRRVRRDRAPGLPRGALGRRLSEPGQDGRRVLRRRRPGRTRSS